MLNAHNATSYTCRVVLEILIDILFLPFTCFGLEIALNLYING